MQLRPKIIACLLASLSPIAAWAQTKLHLDFESADAHRVWIGEAIPTDPTATEVKTQSTEVTVDAALKNPMVWVENERTGNMASHDVGSLAGKWLLKDEDYKSIARVNVRVESKGQPVASAIVKLSGANLHRSSFLSPSDSGQLSFLDVAPGTVNLVVQYKVRGKDAQPIKQSFDIALRRDRPQPLLTVSIPGSVDVVPPSGELQPPPGAAASPTSNQTSAQPSASPTGAATGDNLFGRVLTLLIVVALIGGGCYYVLVVMRRNGDTVKDKLRQMGVDIPKSPGDPDDAPPAPIALQRAAGPPDKILLTDAPADPVAQPSAPIALTGNPTLRMANGDAFELPEGETVVGRELGLGLSLLNETTVSRQHASLTRTGSQVLVKDLGSSNGTFVNGQKVSGEATVRPGDTVQFGAVQCRLEG